MKKRFGKATVLLAIAALLCVMIAADAFAAEIDGMLRIRLTRPGTVSEISIALTDDYVIKGTDKQLSSGSVLTATDENGTITLKVNGKQTASGETIELLRCGSGQTGFTFTMPALDNSYCGDLSLTASGDVITPILTIYTEDYLYGAVSAAMSAGTSAEALKAEAVAARSFILCKRASMSGAAYDATDSAADQLFNGYDASRSDAVAAVDETAGQVLYSDGTIAACYTTASNGGQTESTENVWGTALTYSVMKNDSYDAESADAAVKTAEINKDGSDLNASLKSALIEGMAQQLEGWGLSTSANDVEIVSIDAIDLMDPMYEESQLYQHLNFRLSVRSVNLSTGKPVNCSVTVAVPTYSGFEKWYDLSINSSDNETVSVAKVNEQFKVMFRREGHGIGLSCCGAQVMASTYAKSYQDILDFYYPGTELKTETLKRAENTAAQAGGSGAVSYALPTLVPRATVEPTPTPEPTQKVTWTTEEPQSAETVSPVFTQGTGKSSGTSSFIAGQTVDNQQTNNTAVQNTAAPTAASTIPALQATEKPKATATPKATEQPQDASSMADEISIGNLNIDIDDIDYSVGSSDGLGALDTNGDPDLADSQSTDSSSKKTTSESGTTLKGFDTNPSYDIDTNVDDDSVLGPMANGEDDTAEAGETDASANMKEPEEVLYGVITLEESSTLTLRTEASVTSTPIAYIANGAPVRVLAYNSEWLYAETVDGLKGYLARAYVEKISEAEALELAENTETEEDDADFFNDDSDDEIDDDMDFFDDDTEETSEEVSVEDSEDLLEGYNAKSTDVVLCDFNAVTTANVRLHENPSLTSFTLMTITGGETVSVAAYNDEWAYVEYSGVSGYIYRTYLKKA